MSSRTPRSPLSYAPYVMLACIVCGAISLLVYVAMNNDAKQMGPGPGGYVYDFIVKEQVAYTHGTNKYGIHITDIRADGVRVTDAQIEVKVVPNHAKCNSKAGGYECQGDNYGMNDPEPVNPAMADLTWSAWNREDTQIGTNVLTITMPTKVTKFEMDFFRPKYVPGWTIKENGIEVLTSVKGANTDTPTPITVNYTIP